MTIVRLLASDTVILSEVPPRSAASSGSFSGRLARQPAVVPVCTGTLSIAPLSILSWIGSATLMPSGGCTNRTGALVSAARNCAAC